LTESPAPSEQQFSWPRVKERRDSQRVSLTEPSNILLYPRRFSSAAPRLRKDPEPCVVLVMERRPAEQPSSSPRSSSSQPCRKRPETTTPIDERQSLEISQQDHRRRSPLTAESEGLTDDSPGKESQQTRRRWSQRRSTSGSPDRVGRQSVREPSKGKEREMTGEGRRETAASPSERRLDNAQTSTASPSGQGSEETRGEKKDAAGERAGGGRGRGRGSGSGSGRARLVSGVFVRY